MKSSTIRRSTLSKESMEVIEILSKDNDYNVAPAEYVRPDDVVEIPYGDIAASKAQEIDMLWQSFKTAQFNSKSPMAYIIVGFVFGVISTLIVLFCMGALAGNMDSANTPAVKKSFSIMNIFSKPAKNTSETLDEQVDFAQKEVGAKVVVPTEDESPSNPLNIFKPAPEKTEQVSNTIDTSKAKKYKVKDGDTVEKIIKMHYGSYSPERAELIRKANNMETLDRINIDQELIIPVQE